MARPRRCALAAGVAALCATAPPALATAEDVGGSTLLGLGVGPSAWLGGALGQRFEGEGTAGRIRFGGRVGRIGFELTTTVVGLRGGDLERPGLLLWTPTLAYHLVTHPNLQLAVRAGLGVGSISGTLHGPSSPCEGFDQPSCPNTETVSHPGFGLDVGANLQLHLGRKRGGRAILWADVGLARVRFQLPAGVTDGHLLVLTVGIAHGMQM